QVLANDVGEKSRFAGARHSQGDSLHDANLIGPEPRLAMNVIPQHDRVLLPGLADDAFVASRGYHQRPMGPFALAPRAPGEQTDETGACTDDGDGEVQSHLHDLAAGDVVPVLGHLPGEPAT